MSTKIRKKELHNARKRKAKPGLVVNNNKKSAKTRPLPLLLLPHKVVKIMLQTTMIVSTYKL